MDHPSWHTEKEQLLLKHTEEKLKYITEIQMLRKSLSPEKEQILKDLRQVHQSRDCLETEVIHTQSRNDELRVRTSFEQNNTYYFNPILIILQLIITLFLPVYLCGYFPTSRPSWRL